MPTYPRANDPLALLADADGTTEAHSLRHGRTARAAENIMAYGAVGDGITNDTAAIQAAVDAVGTKGGNLLFPPGKTYLVSSAGIVLPSYPGTDFVRLNISGYGATIKATTAIPMMTRATPANMTDVGNWQLYRFTIEGLRFLGNGTSGQVGLDMIATYGLVVRDCQFESCDTGLRITNGLMSRVVSCFDKTCVSYGFHVRSGNGLWAGASIPNSPSNHTSFYSCRSYGANGALAQFYIRGSSGVRIEECIVEGGNPVNSIDWSAEGDTSIKQFEIRNVHSENSPTNAVIKTDDNGGTIILEGIFIVNPNLTLIQATGISSALLARGISWPSGSKLKHRDASTTTGEPLWIFPDGVGNSRGEDVDLFNTGNWVGGIVPKYLHVERTGSVIGTRGSQINPSDGFLAIKGNVEMSKLGSYIQFTENSTADPLAPGADTGRLYVRDNGAGKGQLCVRFPTGTVQVLATEP